jgi:hypothetical protein
VSVAVPPPAARGKRHAWTLPAPRAALVPALALAVVPRLAVAQAHPRRVAHPHPAVATVPYLTHAGDTLYEIAARYLYDVHDWPALARLNHVPAPRRLPAGIVLKLPAALLREQAQSAQVVATSGPVEHAFGAGPYTPLVAGMLLGEGDRVRTGDQGFVTLRLPDGSCVMVSQRASIDILRLRKTVLTDAGDRVIGLGRGEVDSEVTHARHHDDRFQIRAPSVVAGVRGTHFRVSYDSADRRTAVEVLDGAVGVDPASAAAPPPGVPLQASQQLVRAHYGSVTDTGGTIGAPLVLLAPPQLQDPGKVQDDATVAFDLAADPRAAGYRVQVGRDADLLDTVRDVRVRAPHAELGALPDGTYFVRIAAIDRNGLEGLSQTYSFERHRLGVDASAQASRGHDYRFRWFASGGAPTRFRFVLGTSPDLRAPLVDRPDLSGSEIVVSDLPRGVYYWTVIAEQFDNGRFYQKGSPIRVFTQAR